MGFKSKYVFKRSNTPTINSIKHAKKWVTPTAKELEEQLKIAPTRQQKRALLRRLKHLRSPKSERRLISRMKRSNMK